MPRYASYLLTGMAERGHRTELWQPQPGVYNWPVPQGLKKWLGYIDQYVVFPQEVKQRIRRLPKDTLFVLTDHALGPYVPLIANRPHVIHCHDFLAQQSALGELPENPTSWTGQHYQAYIRRGFSQGKNFISISDATQHDLHRVLGRKPPMSEIVYNGLVTGFTPAEDVTKARIELQHELPINVSDGFLLHVGGNQWYKNRSGIIQLYTAWRASSNRQLPLLLAGSAPSEELLALHKQSPVRDSIYFLTGASDGLVKKLYQAASMLLFPSLAEGFGWPIIEAMASGCPVVTTNASPMTEVAGGAAFLIPRLQNGHNAQAWAVDAAAIVDQIIRLSPAERHMVVASGLLNAQRFNAATHLDRIEQFYKTVVVNSV
jgi:glycosyltransferase involved in cell wall biosynthesis